MNLSKETGTNTSTNYATIHGIREDKDIALPLSPVMKRLKTTVQNLVRETVTKGIDAYKNQIQR